jgi:hypothetical protein
MRQAPAAVRPPMALEPAGVPARETGREMNAGVGQDMLYPTVTQPVEFTGWKDSGFAVDAQPWAAARPSPDPACLTRCMDLSAWTSARRDPAGGIWAGMKPAPDGCPNPGEGHLTAAVIPRTGASPGPPDQWPAVGSRRARCGCSTAAGKYRGRRPGMVTTAEENAAPVQAPKLPAKLLEAWAAKCRQPGLAASFPEVHSRPSPGSGREIWTKKAWRDRPAQ